ncbi:hypothetical protein MMC25_005958 [Agyrium rufum]|nr:hypothetical protein [Agyrium rufum]
MSATSSSIQIPGEGQNWHRNAARVPNWQSPGIHNSQLSLGPISTRYGGEPLDDDNLSEIAEFFLELDLTALDLVEEIVVKNGGRVVPDLPTQQKIQAIQDELHLIQNRQYHFHEDFLRNTVLSHCAERGLFILEAMIGEPALQHKLGDEGHKTFPKMTRQLSGVPRMIVNAASHGSLSPDLRRALRRLWVKVDELSELLVKSKHLDPGDALPRWPEIITTINSVVPHKLKKDEGGSVNNLLGFYLVGDFHK